MATALSPRRDDDAARIVQEDRTRSRFKVDRKAFTSQEIFEREREAIFGKCWLYLGHESELPNPNDFVTRQVGGRPIIFNRDRKGNFQAFFNTCPHRGAQVEREKCGNAIRFKCFYHGWAFNNNGKFATKSPVGAYPQDFDDDGSVDLARVPHLDQHRGFYFVNFDKGAGPLKEYLAGVTEILDIVSDHSADGMEIIGGVQEYSIRANWKLLFENSIDGYHASETHSTYFEYLLDAQNATAAKLGGTETLDFGNGHVAIEFEAPWGRPIARWTPAWGEAAKADMEALKAELVERLGEDYADRIARVGRNTGIFPNLVINDIMAITVRTFFPIAPDLMHVWSFALAPKGESRTFRKRRNDNFLEFLGPGGFATPDDIEALESAQIGYRNMADAPFNDISLGMLGKNDLGNEEQMRIFWREWSRRVEGPGDEG